jgi:hypothetical protein
VCSEGKQTCNALQPFLRSFAPTGATINQPGAERSTPRKRRGSAAPGPRNNTPLALKGRNIDLCHVLSGLRYVGYPTRGGGNARVRVPLPCPGLICFGPFGACSYVSNIRFFVDPEERATSAHALHFMRGRPVAPVYDLVADVPSALLR